jgi:hypothetical protein
LDSKAVRCGRPQSEIGQRRTRHTFVRRSRCQPGNWTAYISSRPRRPQLVLRWRLPAEITQVLTGHPRICQSAQRETGERTEARHEGELVSAGHTELMKFGSRNTAQSFVWLLLSQIPWRALSICLRVDWHLRVDWRGDLTSRNAVAAHEDATLSEISLNFQVRKMTKHALRCQPVGARLSSLLPLPGSRFVASNGIRSR